MTATAAPARTLDLDILGVPMVVRSQAPEALARVEETYAAFRPEGAAAEPEGGAPCELHLRREAADRFTVEGPGAQCTSHQGEHAALLALLDRMVKSVLGGLCARGIDAIHAGAIVHRGGAAILSGVSGRGKTTLTLGLVARGAGLLSDEFAVLVGDTTPGGSVRVAPYRRAVHIRPGTPELIPELGFACDLPTHALGGGIEWSVPPDLLERHLPGCLAGAAPLRHVLLLEGRPDPARAPSITPLSPAQATMELLRGTYSASLDFAGSLRRVGAAVRGATCARLTAGALAPTLDLVLDWLDGADG